MFKSLDQLQLPIHDWLFENASDSIIFVDSHGEIVAANQASFELLRMDPEPTERLKAEDYIDMDFVTKPYKKEMLVRTKTKPERLVIMRAIQIGEYMCLNLKEGGLKAKKDSLLYTLNHARNGPYEGVMMHNRGKIVDCDFAFSSMIGYKRSELVGMSVFDLVHKEDHQTLYEHMQQWHHDTPYPLRGFKKDGTTIYAEILPEPVNDDNNHLRVAIVRNITERVENEKQIEFMAYYDALTDLPNRNYFQKVLQEETKNADENGQKLAVHFIDLDYFKHINDTLGYQMGDALLKGCATRLKKLLLEDVFIARMTSDEFLILQRNITDTEEVEALAEKIIELFKQPMNLVGYEIYTSVSVGISIYPDLAETPSEVVEHADSAMYLIKEESRNDYRIFEPSLKEDFKERLHIETELHKALKQKAFELHFQPQLDLKTTEVIGFEALCRWQHEEMGFIPPDRFIPLAEKTGLIFELGDWVIREACRQNKLWQDQGLPKVKVSVNLSAKQFLQKNLVDKVRDILFETGLEPDYLELEITESMAMSNEKYIIETLNEFRQLGVKVALDDFGTGYSSLKYLSQFPLSKIKIDRMFIQNQSEQNIAIVKTIIHLSHSLNLRVIAEGVENKEDLDFLLQEKCDEVQGYYFSKPIPANDVKNFFITS
ncbi:EAL domain-containing protein [Alkalibacillus aidingensis]|uniref:EAL domain-containing protein n=1 Tax=Alkalibacillus aidingensis TaxID=2747607 RepID=UPI001661244D|nr:EAL domain-containing protein [Alkalibacillus aidingensis]